MKKKLSKELSAGTEADSSTKAEGMQVSPANAKPNVSRRIAKLPKWAQFEISKRDMYIESLCRKLHQAEKVNEITSNMNWFTIGVHTKERRNLYFLDKDHPNLVATVGKGYVLLVGYPKDGG